MQGVKGTGSNTERNRKWLAKNPGYKLAQQREWRARNPGYLGPKRQALVDRMTAFKEATPCVDCAARFPACCMDFDHRGLDKHEEVGRLVARCRPWEVIAAEIDKCDLVCANCHRIRTQNKGSSGWSRRIEPIERDEEPKGKVLR